MCYMRGWKYKCGHVSIEKTVHRCPSSAKNVFPNPHCYRRPGVMYPKKNPLQEKNCPECEEIEEKGCAEEQTAARLRTSSIVSTADDEEIAQASSLPNERQDDDDDDDGDQNFGGYEESSGGVVMGEDVDIDRHQRQIGGTTTTTSADTDASASSTTTLVEQPAAPAPIRDDTAEASTAIVVVQPATPFTATADTAEPLDGDEGEMIGSEETDTAANNPTKTPPPLKPKKRSFYDPRRLFGL